jgi:hypothetical protein
MNGAVSEGPPTGGTVLASDEGATSPGGESGGSGITPAAAYRAAHTSTVRT